MGMNLVHESDELWPVEEMREAWRANRSALTASFDQPGRRPYGFWRFDVGLTPEAVPNWQDEEIAQLEQRGLLTVDERVRLGRTR